MNILNNFSITVYVQDTNFKQKLDDFLATKDLIKKDDENNNNTSFAFNSFKILTGQSFYNTASARAAISKLEKVAPVFLFIEEKDKSFTFTFFNLSNNRELIKDSRISGDYEKIADIFHKAFLEEWTILLKQTIAKDLLSFIKEEVSLEKIEFNQVEFLSKINEGTKFNFLRDMYMESIGEEDSNVKEDIYTSTVSHYDAIISSPNELLEMDISSLGDAEIQKMLKNKIKNDSKPKFMQIKKLIVAKHSDGKFHVTADKDCRKVWNKPVNVTDEVSLIFVPIMVGSDKNYSGLVTLMQEQFPIRLEKSEMEVSWAAKRDDTTNTIYQDHQAPEDRYYKNIYSTLLKTKESYASISVIGDFLKSGTAGNPNALSLSDSIDDVVEHICKTITFKGINKENIRASLAYYFY